MANQEIIAQLNRIISGFLEEAGYELVELICRHEGRNLVLRLLVDKLAGGITMGECAALNHRLSQLLDEKEVISNRYILEVAFPGLDRLLKTKKDFMRYLHKQVVFFLNDLVNGKCQWQGEVSRVDDTGVFIDSAGQILEIPLIKINKATLII